MPSAVQLNAVHRWLAGGTLRALLTPGSSLAAAEGPAEPQGPGRGSRPRLPPPPSLLRSEFSVLGAGEGDAGHMAGRWGGTVCAQEACCCAPSPPTLNLCSNISTMLTRWGTAPGTSQPPGLRSVEGRTRIPKAASPEGPRFHAGFPRDRDHSPCKYFIIRGHRYVAGNGGRYERILHTFGFILIKSAPEMLYFCAVFALKRSPPAQSIRLLEPPPPPATGDPPPNFRTHPSGGPLQNTHRRPLCLFSPDVSEESLYLNACWTDTQNLNRTAQGEVLSKSTNLPTNMGGITSSRGVCVPRPPEAPRPTPPSPGQLRSALGGSLPTPRCQGPRLSRPQIAEPRGRRGQI